MRHARAEEPQHVLVDEIEPGEARLLQRSGEVPWNGDDEECCDCAGLEQQAEPLTGESRTA